MYIFLYILVVKYYTNSYNSTLQPYAHLNQVSFGRVSINLVLAVWLKKYILKSRYFSNQLNSLTNKMSPFLSMLLK